jgi:hypothetical protein
MNHKIRIYADSGANIKCLDKYYSYIEFYQFPYDSAHRPKKAIENGIIKLALSSDAQWQDSNQAWEESNFLWEELPTKYFQPLEHFMKNKLSGQDIRRDVLHLDSAIKTDCEIFITSDYQHIASNKKEIKNICGIEVFLIPKELVELIGYIRELKKKTVRHQYEKIHITLACQSKCISSLYGHSNSHSASC